MTLEVTSYLDKFPARQQPPDDLLHFYGLLARIKRYKLSYYPEGVFDGQNVGIHCQRMVEFWKSIDLPDGCDWGEGLRMIWVHDIPEVIVGDEPAVKLDQDKVLAQRRDILEQEAARKILQEHDKPLFESFEGARKFWKGEAVVVNPTALTVRLVDIIDGNLVYNQLLSQYCLEEARTMDPKMTEAIRYAFNQDRTLRSRLGLLPSSLSSSFQELVNYHVDSIASNWARVPRSNRPKVISEELASLPE